MRPNYVARAVANLKGTAIAVAAVIGFHEGTQPLTEKIRYSKRLNSHTMPFAH